MTTVYIVQSSEKVVLCQLIILKDLISDSAGTLSGFSFLSVRIDCHIYFHYFISVIRYEYKKRLRKIELLGAIEDCIELVGLNIKTSKYFSDTTYIFRVEHPGNTPR